MITNFAQFSDESINENVDINKKYVNDFLNEFGFFITLNISQISTMGIDNNANSELSLMQKNLRNPIINGMTYFEITKDVNYLYKNPKILSALLNKIREFLIYIEPRIQKYVKDSDIKDNWLKKIENFKEKYKKIIS